MAELNPVQVRRLLARTLRVALDGGPAHQQLIDRWAAAEAPEDSWIAAVTWDGVGGAMGWALAALELRDVAPPELDLLAADAYNEARTQAVQLSADLAQLGAEFEAAGLSSIALKGSALLAANVAPALGIRWMSDIDLLVSERDVEQAAWVLESLDYTRGLPRDQSGPELFRPYHETFTSPEGRAVELHWRLGPARWGRAAAASEWFGRAEPSAMRGLLVPSASDLFWHFLLHDARNHAWSSGSLRAALDLALAARAPGFDLEEVLSVLAEDRASEPLLEGIADAAHLSPILAAGVEPSVEPRYLRLARWRDVLGRRQWKTERVAEAIAWGATLDRARRFGGWRSVVDRAVRIIPEAAPGAGLGASALRALLTMRHTAFVGALALGHLISVPGAVDHRRRLPAPRPPSA
jgi:hypothetical protein